VKKKVFIGLFVSLFVFFTLTSQVLAAAPAITSINPNSGVQANTYPSIIISGTGFTGATAVSFGADITVNSYVVDTDTQITANIKVPMDAAVGARDVSVTTPEGTATSAEAFTVIASSISVSAPNGIALGDMVRGLTVTGTSTPAGSVNTNAQNWQVTAIDAKGSNTGFMTKGGTTPLLAEFQISREGIATNLANAHTGITYNQTSNSNQQLPFYVSQSIDTNEAAGSYSITITFTGTVQ
jgi:hypothetical protein